MSDFKDSINWEYAVSRLRTACIGQPVELQVVWMFEILAILLFLKYKGKTPLVQPLDGAYRITHRHMPSLAEGVGISKPTMGRLSDYRDKFVHFGYLEATSQLETLFNDTSSEELDRLQQFTGVTLNMRNSLA